jgi:uncharacterized protein YybS (DUF2232 family)
MDNQFQALEISFGIVAIFIGILTSVLQAIDSFRKHADLLAMPIRYLRYLTWSVALLLAVQTIQTFGPKMFRFDNGQLLTRIQEFSVLNGVVLAVSGLSVFILIVYAKQLRALESLVLRFRQEWPEDRGHDVVITG